MLHSLHQSAIDFPQTFQSSTTTMTPSPSMRSRMNLWSVLLLAISIVVIPFALKWLISARLRDPNAIPPGPRGSMILRLRTPADQLPVRDLELYLGGIIWSGTIDEMYFSSDRHAAVHTTYLDQTTLEAVLRFQEAWCSRDPIVYQPTTKTPAYGLSIWCDGSIDEAHIAPSALPTALREVVNKVFQQ